jgi:hypothetical protein
MMWKELNVLCVSHTYLVGHVCGKELHGLESSGCAIADLGLNYIVVAKSDV